MSFPPKPYPPFADYNELVRQTVGKFGQQAVNHADFYGDSLIS